MAVRVALLGHVEKRVPGPLLLQRVVGLAARSRVHLPHVEAGVFEEAVIPCAGRLDLAARHRRHGEPMAVLVGEVFHHVRLLAVMPDRRVHEVVERLQLVGVGRRRPRDRLQDVVPGLRLRFGGEGQLELVALGGDEVDGDVDLVLLRPLVADRLHGLVRARDPVVPESDRQLPGRARGVNVREHRRRGRRCGCLDESTSIELPAHCDFLLRLMGRACLARFRIAAIVGSLADKSLDAFTIGGLTVSCCVAARRAPSTPSRMGGLPPATLPPPPRLTQVNLALSLHAYYCAGKKQVSPLKHY